VGRSEGKRPACSTAPDEIMVEDPEALMVALTSGDDDRAEASVIQLAAHSEALPAITSLLHSPELDVRWWAVRALAQMESPPKDLLVRALDDGSEEVRQCAILALAHHPTETAIPSLLQLVTDPDAVTVNLAATALIAIGTPAVPALLDLIENASHVVRIEIVRALASIGDPRAIPALMNALEQDSPAMHFWAEQGLDRLGLGMIYMKSK